MWNVHVFPVAAGHVTGIELSIGALAVQFVVLHFAVAAVLFTTNVVVTNVSLEMMVWAFAGAAPDAMTAKIKAVSSLIHMTRLFMLDTPLSDGFAPRSGNYTSRPDVLFRRMQPEMID